MEWHRKIKRPLKESGCWPAPTTRSSSKPDQELSERILFPATPSQRNGIEDARFVRFQNDDGTHRYYATFTAYDGRVVVPELVETSISCNFASSR